MPRRRRRQREAQDIRSARDLARLSEREQAARYRAFRAVDQMHGRGRSLKQAAREAGTTPRTVRRYFGEQLSKRGARFVMRRPATGPFAMTIVSSSGVVERVVDSARGRSLIGRHHNAIQAHLAGHTEALKPFKNKRIAGVELETDSDRVVDLWRLGELDFLEIYQLTS